MNVPHVPILSPEQLPISLGTPLDGRSKTAVSDLINLYGFVVFRGYDVTSDQEFHDFIECFGLPTSPMPNRSLTLSGAIAQRAYLPRMKRRLRSKFFYITKWHKR